MVPGSILSPERPAWGRSAHPAPCAHPQPLEENNRSGTPFRLPSRREPNFLYLGRGGGFYAKGARPELTLAPAGEERRGWALPKPIPPREAARSLGDSWARHSSAGTIPLPLPAGCSLLSASALSPAGASQARGEACQAAEFRVPSASQLSYSRDSHLFSCVSGRTPGPPSLPFSTLCRTKASLEQEKDDPLDFGAKTATRLLPY